MTRHRAPGCRSRRRCDRRRWRRRRRDPRHGPDRVDRGAPASRPSRAARPPSSAATWSRPTPSRARSATPARRRCSTGSAAPSPGCPRSAGWSRPGGTLYRVDGAPVVLFNGTVPAYRDLSASDTDGADVKELKQNLKALGFDPDHEITVNDTFDAATTTAVERWQQRSARPRPGRSRSARLCSCPALSGSPRSTRCSGPTAALAPPAPPGRGPPPRHRRHRRRTRSSWT